ncbi:hypothetical protein SAMN05216391_1364 [Lachnospiraceae bacterium KHCPX20]|nr:hypothetical protein SAMN05216391_1364 [Lachnospiraceae bacterium KHCPX20]
MEKFLRKFFVILVAVVFVNSFAMIAYAGSYSFGAEMNYRMVDGKKNGVTYSIGSDKTIKVNGKIGAYSYDRSDHEGVAGGALCGPQSTTICLCESNWWGGKIVICSTSVKVSALNQVKSFSCSGKSETSRDKYIYIYKPLNDGFNMSISGTIKY